jgi:maltooligosyltrehalose trehalohydrolase
LLDDARFFGGFGTLPPARRASDSPMAIACLGLVTFLPERPLLSLPRFISCIARSTFSDAFFPYFFAMDRPGCNPLATPAWYNRCSSLRPVSDPIRIWAPRARARATLVVGPERHDLVPDGDGWWRGPRLADGTEYAISLDDGPPMPDPRSRWQPHGVHGVTRAITLPPPAEPRFVATPLARAVLYELHVGTFTREGTFAAAAKRLDHLVALGVTHVELMPVAQFPGAHGWGYDGVQLFAAHDAYGGPAGLRAFIAACHAKELGVFVDVVHNHLGPEGNYLDRFGPFHTDKHASPWGPGINFDDAGSAHVRRYFIDSALTWLDDYGADGLRLDAVDRIEDASERHFLNELACEVSALAARTGRELPLVGEYDRHDPWVLRDDGGRLHAHWNDDFHHALHVLLTGEAHSYYVDYQPRDALVDILHNGYYLDGRHSTHRGGPHGTAFGPLPRDRLIAFTQSHDQVGNRAGGERLVHLCGMDRAKIAAAVLLVSPFVPLVFQGEEWGATSPFFYFADLSDEELRRAVREGRAREHRSEHLPDPLDPSTRERSILRWDELDHAPHAQMRDWYAHLIGARRNIPALHDSSPGSTRARLVGDLLRVDRGPYTLLANLGEGALHVDTKLDDIVLASKDLARRDELPPVSCALVRLA